MRSRGTKLLGARRRGRPRDAATSRPDGALGIASGVPDSLARPDYARDGPPRTAYITHGDRPATQSGLLHRWSGRPWRISFDRGAPGLRWANPLMGWTSGADAMQAVAIGGFASAEAAAGFARAQGWRPVVQSDDTPAPDAVKPVSYGDNFSYTPKVPKIFRTK